MRERERKKEEVEGKKKRKTSAGFIYYCMEDRSKYKTVTASIRHSVMRNILFRYRFVIREI